MFAHNETENISIKNYLKTIVYNNLIIIMQKINYSNQLALFITLLLMLNACKKEDKTTMPVITTTSISSITANGATCGGNISDDGGATITLRGVCWSLDPTPTILNSKTIDGAGAGTFSSTITGLDGGKTYFIRAYATNNSGTGYGMALSFKTLGNLPDAFTMPAKEISTISAELNATVPDNQLPTTVSFEYGTSTTYGNTVIAINRGSNSFSSSISGLSVATIYHFRVKAVNSLGTTYGSDQTFKTLGALPIATTQNATEILTNSATLNGIVYANDLSTTVIFEYGLTTNYGNFSTPSQSPVIGATNLGFGMPSNITGLINNTLYHFRIKATNIAGTVYGNDMTFTTLGKSPTIVSSKTNRTTAISATLNGLINGNGYSTVATFEYGTSETYGTTAQALQNPIIGGLDTPVYIDLNGLSPNTTYHFRIKAVNQLGTTLSGDQSFTTSIMISDIDGNDYNTVTLGNQIWMAENLKTTKFNNGNLIPVVVQPNVEWRNLSGPGYYSINGLLYNWATVSTGNLCPIDWHVPSDLEWTTLSDFLSSNGYGNSGSGSEIAKSLAYTANWELSNIIGSIGNNQLSNNSSGFSALPLGFLSPEGTFLGGSTYTIWWTSTEKDAINAYQRVLHYSFLSLAGAPNDKKSGFSVRCMRNK